MSYDYFNEAGEPLMDGAAMRYEMYLDSIHEPDIDDHYESWDCEPDGSLDPMTCSHDNTDEYDAGWHCYDCDTEFQGPLTDWAMLDPDRL